MALIVGGTTVTGTQVLGATKLSGTLPALDGSSLVSLNASELDSGTVANARISSGSVTQHVSAVTNTVSSWSPSFNNFTADSTNARYVKVGRSVQASVDFRRTGNTSTDNLAYISGLPFTSVNGGYIVGGGICSGHHAYGSGYGMVAIVFDKQMYFIVKIGVPYQTH